jgi:hypothetical protein
MTLDWIDEAMTLLVNPETDARLKGIEVVERSSLGEYPDLTARRAARVLVELLTRTTEGPPYLRARAHRAGKLLASELARANEAVRIRQEAERIRRAELRQKVIDAAAARTTSEASLQALGLPKARIDALLAMKAGPYDVVLHGLKRGFNEELIEVELEELGFLPGDVERVLRRAEHINEPEVLGYLLDEDAAIDLKVRLEDGGAKIRIKRHQTTK